MNSTQSQMMAKLGQFSRNHGFFCSEFSLKPATCSLYLEDLQERGYIVQIQTGYKLTQAGRNYMDCGGRTVEPRRYCSNTTGEIYKPSNWTPARGESAEAALRIPSRGVSC